MNQVKASDLNRIYSEITKMKALAKQDYLKADDEILVNAAKAGSNSIRIRVLHERCYQIEHDYYTSEEIKEYHSVLSELFKPRGFKVKLERKSECDSDYEEVCHIAYLEW